MWIYPPAPRSRTFDTYQSETHGPVNVSSPYKWMESDTLPRRVWAAAEERFTAAYSARYRELGLLRDVLMDTHGYKTFSAPIFTGSHWYWMARTRDQEQSVLYRSKTSSLPIPSDDLEDRSELWFDTNILSEDGSTSLTSFSFSSDGELVIYAVTVSGNDIHELLVCRAVPIQSKQDLHNALVETMSNSLDGYSLWGEDSKGFYYAPAMVLARETPNSGTKGVDHGRVLYHSLGTPSTKDKLIVQSDRGEVITMFPSGDGNYMMISSSRDPAGDTQLWIAPRGGNTFQWVKLNQDYRGALKYSSNDGLNFTFVTSVQSDRLHVVSWTFDPDGTSPFTNLALPMDATDRYLQQYFRINDEYSVAVYLKNVKFELYVMKSTGEVDRLDAGFDGSITLSRISDGFFATFDGYIAPPAIKKWQVQNGKVTWSDWRNSTYTAISLANLIVSQVWYPSVDGTKIPMYVLYDKSTKLDGTAPLLQHGYGYYVPLLPSFSPTWVTFAAFYGGVVAFPNIRGGLEFGQNWAEAGSKENLMNTVYDFVSATSYLVKQGYVDADKTSIYGWSAGGELVTGSIAWAEAKTFRAAVANKGSHDTLRFPLFHPGVYWTGDMGDPSEPHDFDYIYPASSLHHFPTDKALPDTLVLAAGSDMRVNKMHPYKMAATLQYSAPPGSGVQLLKTIPKEGHLSDKNPRKLQVEDDFLVFSFIANSMGLSLRSLEHLSN